MAFSFCRDISKSKLDLIRKENERLKYLIKLRRLKQLASSQQKSKWENESTSPKDATKSSAVTVIDAGIANMKSSATETEKGNCFVENIENVNVRDLEDTSALSLDASSRMSGDSPNSKLHNYESLLEEKIRYEMSRNSELWSQHLSLSQQLAERDTQYWDANYNSNSLSEDQTVTHQDLKCKAAMSTEQPFLSEKRTDHMDVPLNEKKRPSLTDNSNICECTGNSVKDEGNINEEESENKCQINRKIHRVNMENLVAVQGENDQFIMDTRQNPLSELCNCKETKKQSSVKSISLPNQAAAVCKVRLSCKKHSSMVTKNALSSSKQQGSNHQNYDNTTKYALAVQKQKSLAKMLDDIEEEIECYENII